MKLTREQELELLNNYPKERVVVLRPAPDYRGNPTTRWHFRDKPAYSEYDKINLRRQVKMEIIKSGKKLRQP